jgi:hypothetical protein
MKHLDWIVREGENVVRVKRQGWLFRRFSAHISPQTMPVITSIVSQLIFKA